VYDFGRESGRKEAIWKSWAETVFGWRTEGVD
jgi:hypothetical protein